MSTEMLVARLRRHSELSDGDVDALISLNGRTKSYSSGSITSRDGGAKTDCSLLHSGVAVGHKIVGDGGRQIISMYLPGELLDFDGMFLQSLDYNIQAISDCEISLFPRDGLIAMMFERPSIGRALFRDTMIRAAISREWMTNLGRRDSRTKVAHLLCELTLRLKVIGGYDNHGFELPITQEQISDIIGVTPMHVGRVLKELSREGLIDRANRHIKVVDEEKLKLTGDFKPTYLESAALDRR